MLSSSRWQTKAQVHSPALDLFCTAHDLKWVLHFKTVKNKQTNKPHREQCTQILGDPQNLRIYFSYF